MPRPLASNDVPYSTDGGHAPPPRVLAPPLTPPSLDRVRQLVAVHTPALALHHDDPFLPCSGSWFASRSTLLRDGQRVGRVGSTSLAAALAEQAALGGPAAARASLRLDLDPAARVGVPANQLPSVPIYVRAQLAVPPVDYGGGRRATLEITYIALYAYNGPYFPFGKLIGPGVGAHDGDWERVSVRVDAESGEVIGVWYNSHRPRDGHWVAAAAAPRSPCGRLLAFVARHGHGTYGQAGVIPRAFGFANDHTSGDGPVWRPATAVMLRVHSHNAPHATLGRVTCRGCEVDAGGARGVPPPPSSSSSPAVKVTDDTDGVGDYAGDWGTVLAPRSQGWWDKAECPTSRGTAMRLFCQAWPEPE